MRLIMILALMLASGACAVAPQNVQYRRATESWIGASIEDVIAAWGDPGGTEPLPDGGRQYLWEEPVLVLSAPEPTTDICTRGISADKTGRVVQAKSSYSCWQSYELPRARDASSPEIL